MFLFLFNNLRGNFSIIFKLVVDSRILILLVFRNQVVHVGLGFSEFHLVHTFASVPMKEGFATEHG
uniref:Uncharacterized protein n=1 Tax=Meloidogyne incognita TaxID=6306 RepID=A0A914KH58_MELIC